MHMALDKATPIRTVGDFIEFKDNVTGKDERWHLLNWNQIAEVTQGDGCCWIRMIGAQSDFCANVDYAALKTWLWEKTDRDKDKRGEWP